MARLVTSVWWRCKVAGMCAPWRPGRCWVVDVILVYITWCFCEGSDLWSPALGFLWEYTSRKVEGVKEQLVNCDVMGLAPGELWLRLRLLIGPVFVCFVQTFDAWMHFPSMRDTVDGQTLATVAQWQKQICSSPVSSIIVAALLPGRRRTFQSNIMVGFFKRYEYIYIYVIYNIYIHIFIHTHKYTSCTFGTHLQPQTAFLTSGSGHQTAWTTADPWLTWVVGQRDTRRDLGSSTSGGWNGFFLGNVFGCSKRIIGVI